MDTIRTVIAATLFALLSASRMADAATLSIGPYTPSTTSPFVVPVRIDGAIDLVSWTFDLAYDATDLAIHTACDPFTDPYCSLLTGPITEGPFLTDAAAFPTLFVPGFVLTDGTLTQVGRLLSVHGAWQDPLPGVSGSGVLAYVEFIALANGDPNAPIVVTNPALVSEPGTFALLGIGLLVVLLSRRVRLARTRHVVLPALLALVQVPVVNAENVVNGPYYATPSWDQTLPASSRFLVLSNFGGDAVLDRETGLVWQRTPTTVPTTWLPAFDGYLQQSTGGHKAWRLPTAAEALSLFDPVPVNVEPLPAGHPFRFPAGVTQLWTTTAVEAGFHYQVQYFIGRFALQSMRYADGLTGYALCVRGPGA